MTTPVFVIHGVANRDSEAFAKRVSDLGRSLPGLQLRPVFWGDLGAQDDYLEAVIPRSDLDEDVRDGDAGRPLSPTEVELMKDLLSGPPGTDGAAPPPVRSSPQGRDDGPRIIAEAAAGAQRSGEAVRGSQGEWERMVREEWPHLEYLPMVQDPRILRDIGVALARPEARVPGGVGVEVRGASTWLKQRLRDMDRAAGAVIGAVAGRVNTYVRTELGPNIARFAGDIAVYHRNQDRIQQRVREALREYDEQAGLADAPADQRTGGKANPARFVCHSLGGVITLDMAVRAEDGLHLRGLVTFGSQWPLFQLIDPRAGVPAYSGDPVRLPPTVGPWVNLWEPMDPLAFVAAHVFRLADGSEPDDRLAPHLASSGLWSHSAYWKLPQLRRAVADVFGA